MQLKEGKKINNQLKEWTRKLREPCRGVAGDVEEEEGRGRTEEGEGEDGRAGGQPGIGIMSLPSPPSTEEKSQLNQATPSSNQGSSFLLQHQSTSRNLDYQCKEEEGYQEEHQGGGRERFLTAAVQDLDRNHGFSFPSKWHYHIPLTLPFSPCHRSHSSLRPCPSPPPRPSFRHQLHCHSTRK